MIADRCRPAPVRAICLALALLALAPLSRAVPATTTLSDTLFLINGQRFNGTIHCTNPAFIAADGTQIPQDSIDIRVVNGIFSVTLIPTDGAAQLVSPNASGLFYSCRYTPNPSPGPPQTQFWSIPTSATPIGLAAVIVNPPPVNTFLISLSQLSKGGAATGQCLVWNGPVAQGWGPGQCASNFPFTLTATASQTVTHNFNNLDVDVEVYDGSGTVVIPKGWRVLNANQVLVTFDSAFTGRGVVK